jgi:phenolic acid decarboxylase
LEWIPVGALGDAFLPENNCLPPVQDLAGRKLRLFFDNGWVIEHEFTSGDRLDWQMVEGESDSRQGQETYVATSPRKSIYFVDFIKSGERATSVTMVLDLKRCTFIALIGELPTADESMMPFLTRIAQGKELTSVKLNVLRGGIDARADGSLQLIQSTNDLLGKRVEYTYSPHERYEHIYLNERFYTWRCIDGSEKGLTDTDACHYFKIDENLYLFAWREKIVPTLGIVMVDLDAMKTTGKIVGYESNDFGKLRNFTVGARARVLSITPVE